MIPRDDSSLYIHREPSQLQFNIRVLEQALGRVPSAARAAQIPADLSSNLDEFFEIRRRPEEADQLRP